MLVEAAAVVTIVLFMFLLDWRATAISLTAIPLSILITVAVFQALGLTINTMTLGGLAIAIGELVDDAVVDVENIRRRLRENAKRRASAGIRCRRRRRARRSARASSTPPRSSSGVRAAVRAGGHRGAPLRAARHRLHRLDPRLPTPPSVAGARLLRLPPRRGRRARAGRELARAPAQGGLRAPWAVLPRAPPSSWRPSPSRWCWLQLPRGAARAFLPPFNEGTLTINTAFQPGISLAGIDRLGLIAEGCCARSRKSSRSAAARPRRARRARRGRALLRDRCRPEALGPLARRDRRRHPPAALRAADDDQRRPADLASARSPALRRARRGRLEDLRRGRRHAATLAETLRDKIAAVPGSPICRSRSRRACPRSASRSTTSAPRSTACRRPRSPRASKRSPAAAWCRRSSTARAASTW